MSKVQKIDKQAIAALKDRGLNAQQKTVEGIFGMR